MMPIVFFTIAKSAHSQYIAPFVTACLTTFPEAMCEVMTDADAGEIYAQIDLPLHKRTMIRRIPQRYDGWRKVPEEKRIKNYASRHPSGSIRWLEQPFMLAQYTYICDVDILITDPDLIDFHVKQMKDWKLPYSNIVRQVSEHGDQERMTGCHFCKTIPFYGGIPRLFIRELRDKLSAGVFDYYDERLLYHIVNTCHPLPPEQYRGEYIHRPIHGLHLSAARNPCDTIGWNINEKTIREYRVLAQSTFWEHTRNKFDKRFLEKLEKAEAVMADA